MAYTVTVTIAQKAVMHVLERVESAVARTKWLMRVAWCFDKDRVAGPALLQDLRGVLAESELHGKAASDWYGKDAVVVHVITALGRLQGPSCTSEDAAPFVQAVRVAISMHAEDALAAALDALQGNLYIMTAAAAQEAVQIACTALAASSCPPAACVSAVRLLTCVCGGRKWTAVWTAVCTTPEVAGAVCAIAQRFAQEFTQTTDGPGGLSAEGGSVLLLLHSTLTDPASRSMCAFEPCMDACRVLYYMPSHRHQRRQVVQCMWFLVFGLDDGAARSYVRSAGSVLAASPEAWCPDRRIFRRLTRAGDTKRGAAVRAVAATLADACAAVNGKPAPAAARDNRDRSGVVRDMATHALELSQFATAAARRIEGLQQELERALATGEAYRQQHEGLVWRVKDVVRELGLAVHRGVADAAGETPSAGGAHRHPVATVPSVGLGRSAGTDMPVSPSCNVRWRPPLRFWFCDTPPRPSFGRLVMAHMRTFPQYAAAWPSLRAGEATVPADDDDGDEDDVSREAADADQDVAALPEQGP